MSGTRGDGTPLGREICKAYRHSLPKAWPSMMKRVRRFSKPCVSPSSSRWFQMKRSCIWTFRWYLKLPSAEVSSVPLASSR